MKNASHPSRNLSVLRNLAVRTRLVIGFGSIVGLLAISAVLGVWELQSIEKAVARMEERDLIAERAVGDLRLATQANLARVLAVTLSDAVEIAAPFSLKIGETELEISALLVKIDGILESSREKAALAEVVAKRGAFLGARLEAVRARDAGDAAEGIRLATQRMNPAAEAYAASQAQLATVVAQVRAERAFKAQRATDAGRWLLIAFAALGATAGLVLGAMIAKSISSPISFVIRTSEQLATGDLRERITAQSRSEFGRMISALEEMRAQFSNSIRAIQEATHVVGQEAKQVARGSADLATRTEEQASTLEQTASAMEEFAATVRHGADNAQQASELARRAADVATRGGSIVSGVVSTMTGISESSEQIADIVGVIDGIAFQTNILALNAAVEAARAGEQGRGFAVVASEVRALAQRSAAAAKEIKALIGGAAGRVSEGVLLVEDAGKTMQALIGSVKQVSDIIGEVSLAGREQLAGIEQVSLAVTQLDRVTQQNAALVNSSAAAAESMAHQADLLDSVVAHFQIEATPPDSRLRLAVSPPVDRGESRNAGGAMTVRAR